MTHDPDSTPSDNTAYFGDRPVSRAEKPALVRRVFETVAPRYDLMNDLMSGGLHRWWKSAFVDMLAPRPDMQILDVAGGTGDIAFRIARRTAAHFDDAAVPITVCDVNEAMLAAGRARREAQKHRGIRWVAGDAEALPVANNAVDAYTVAFGMRNVTHLDAALAEARRVLRPGGRFLCLEFSRMSVPYLDTLYDRYSFAVIPALGQWVAGDRESYQYLVESIRRFPDQRRFSAKIAAAGFDRVRHRNLTGGVVAIHSAWRL